MNYTAILLILLLSTTVIADDAYLVEVWNYTVKEVLSGMAIADLDGDTRKGVVAAGSADSFLYNLRDDGLLQWKYAGGGYLNTMEVDGSRVYAGYGRNLYVINESGERIKSYNTGANFLGASIYEITLADYGDGPKHPVFSIYDPQTCSRKKRITAIDVKEKIDGRWSYDPPGNSFAFALDAGDLDGDGMDEVAAGLIRRGKYGGASCVRLDTEPSQIIVFKPDGEEHWSADTESGVFAIKVTDLEGDGKGEVVAGTNSKLYVFNNEGTEKCSFNTGSRIDRLDTIDVDQDGVKEILYGSNNLYVLYSNCTLYWMGDTASRAYSFTTGDLDGDGRLEVAVGSSRIYIFAEDGELLWKTDILPEIYTGFIETGDMEGDGYLELAAGSIKKVRLYKSKAYSLRSDAENYLRIAEDRLGQSDLNAARDNAVKSLKLFNALLMDEEANRALEIIAQVDQIRGPNADSIETKADAALRQARESFQDNDFFNATRHAFKARYLYSSIHHDPGVESAKKLLNQTVWPVIENGTLELAIAENLSEENGSAAMYHAELAQQAFIIAQDSEGKAKAGDMIKKLDPSKVIQDQVKKIITPPKGFDYKPLVEVLGVIILTATLASVSFQYAKKRRLKIKSTGKKKGEKKIARTKTRREGHSLALAMKKVPRK